MIHWHLETVKPHAQRAVLRRPRPVLGQCPLSEGASGTREPVSGPLSARSGQESALCTNVLQQQVAREAPVRRHWPDRSRNRSRPSCRPERLQRVAQRRPSLALEGEERLPMRGQLVEAAVQRVACPPHRPACRAAACIAHCATCALSPASIAALGGTKPTAGRSLPVIESGSRNGETGGDLVGDRCVWPLSPGTLFAAGAWLQQDQGAKGSNMKVDAVVHARIDTPKSRPSTQPSTGGLGRDGPFGFRRVAAAGAADRGRGASVV